MAITTGSREIVVGLIDGPVAVDHPDFSAENVRAIKGKWDRADGGSMSAARAHGTFVAGILSAKRGSVAPAICPGCTLLVRPIFLETPSPSNPEIFNATPAELAAAIVECVDAGVSAINLSVAIARPTPNRERVLEQALNHAADQRTIIVAAAGNQGVVGSSSITRHPWVTPVAACDFRGRPMASSNLSGSIGCRGILAPGEAITSLGSDTRSLTWGGTSAAAPFVTGAIALLWSAFPEATALQVRRAIRQAASSRRTNIVPPLLNAWAAYQNLAAELRGSYRD
jgi:subtilisin family serine protease